MGTIVITINKSVVTAPYPLTKTLTVADADIDNIVAGYQSAANVSVNGTATIAQVWNFIGNTFASLFKSAVQQFQTVPASVPPPINIT